MQGSTLTALLRGVPKAQAEKQGPMGLGQSRQGCRKEIR